MTTRTYDQVLADIEALAGENLTAEEQARVGTYINRRARKAYARTPYWPRFLVIGEERLISNAGILPYDEFGEASIDTLIALHSKAPFKTTESNEYVQWSAEADGFHVTGYESASYSLATGYTVDEVATLSPDIDGMVFKRLSGAVYHAGTLYPLATLSEGPSTWVLGYTAAASGSSSSFSTTAGVGDATPPTGELFTAASNASGALQLAATSLYGIFATYKKPLTETYASGSDVPGEWADYIVQGAYSDWLRSEGQQQKAMLAEAESEEYLLDELEKLSRQNGNVMNTRFVTGTNTQYRT